MSVFRSASRVALAAAVGLCAVAAHAAPLESYASPVRDFSAQSAIISRNMDALKQISNEFAQSYRFASSQVYIKEPNKFRVDSKAGLINVRYVINGNQKVLKAGVINKRWDISDDPGQRQTALTVGLITPSFVDTMNVADLGQKTLQGRKTEVFEVHYKAQPKGSFYRLYMDPERKYVVRSEQYHGDGPLKVTIEYLEPRRVNGVWVPTKTKVYNPQGKLGAVTALQNISVNTGLSDDLFAL